MILAAGRGTRLLPITEGLPKALVEIGGVTLLHRTIGRLVAAGCDRIVVNMHHHAGQIEDELAAGVWPGTEIFRSLEPEGPLETGGGLKQARHLFRGDRTILLHNVDILSSIDLRRLAREHEASGALATLAVNRRRASRRLVFDDSGLCGRIDTRNGIEDWVRTPRVGEWRAGFTGIQALSPELLSRLTEDGAFSIMRPYLRLAAAGARILPHDITGDRWMDVGTPERLEAAREAWTQGA